MIGEDIIRICEAALSDANEIIPFCGFLPGDTKNEIHKDAGHRK